MARVLLIEDDPLMAQTFVVLLKKAGHEVKLAENGLVALKYFQDSPPDIIVTDIIMPEREGLGTIMEVRKLDKDVPIIAYSGGGRHGSDYLPTAAAFGANATLNKPFATEELLEAITTCLEARG